MKKFALLTSALVALSGVAHAQTPTTSTTTTTTQTPVGTTVTTTDVTAPAVAVPAPAPAPAPVVVVPTARDAITGKPLDDAAEKEKSLRDEVREKIKDEASGK